MESRSGKCALINPANKTLFRGGEEYLWSIADGNRTLVQTRPTRSKWSVARRYCG